jgi:hypothetical protein
VLILSSQGNLGSPKVVEPVGVGLALLSSAILALFWILNLRDGRELLDSEIVRKAYMGM